MKRRRTTQKTPLKQTSISNFFAKETSSTKRQCTESIGEGNDTGSPDVIMCTPPSKTALKARKSLHNNFENNTREKSENQGSVTAITTQKNLKPDQFEGKASAHETQLDVGESDFDSAFFEHSEPKSIDNQKENILSYPEGTVVQNSPTGLKNILKNSNTDNIRPYIDDFAISDFSSDFWSPQKTVSPTFSLTFEVCVQCIVVTSELVKNGSIYEKVVDVKEKSGERFGRVLLRDMWSFAVEVEPDYIVSIQALQEKENWVVDAQNGYFILYPDILVSSTALISAMFCRRRGVLSNVFKGLDSDNKIMTMGSLVHELFQKAIEIPSCSKINLEKIINDLLAVPNYLRLLYTCGMTLQDTRKELKYFIPYILNFLKIYVTKEVLPSGDNFPGTISDILDIEENVTSLNLGLKGRIDVTVNVLTGAGKKIMPLELKTGRASFSAEHRNQVIFYTMIMSDLGLQVDSGLLMYLREGILKEIKATRVEKRDAILLRNDFVKYIRQFNPANLPEPIRMVNACKNCPYLTVCTAYLDETVSAGHSIRTVAPELYPKHIEYFHKWSKLLLLEDKMASEDKPEMKMTGIILEEGCVKLKNEFKYSFSKQDRITSLSTGNFVLLHPQDSSRSYSGRIIHVTPSRCSVLLDKEIVEHFGTSFTIEGYQSTLLSRYMTNLGCLMEENNAKLREIIIDRKPAVFSEKIPKSMLSETCLEILACLNKDQQRAVLKMLACENYLLVEGPPGTGKTQTIVAMIKVLVALQQTVLIVGHTHSSVDNILLRLKEVDFIRLGNITSVNKALHEKSFAHLVQRVKSLAEVEKLLSSPVVASTCLGVDDIVSKKLFDVCIVDESSQVLQPEVLKSLFASKKFILIGDPKQLRPVVKCQEAQELGMNQSIFEWLWTAGSVVTLTYQYRMNKVIMALANHLTYGNILKIGSDQVKNGVLSVQNRDNSLWLDAILSPKIEHSVIFVDTTDFLKHCKTNFSCANPTEAKLVVTIIQHFLSCGVLEQNIGVMAPFRAQIQILQQLVPSGVEVNTVDQYQGRDKDCVVFSCTKQDRGVDLKGDYELLNDERRLTVAVTRARFKLVIIGDKDTLMRYRTFQKLFEFLHCFNYVTLREGHDGFSWNMPM